MKIGWRRKLYHLYEKNCSAHVEETRIYLGYLQYQAGTLHSTREQVRRVETCRDKPTYGAQKQIWIGRSINIPRESLDEAKDELISRAGDEGKTKI